MSGCCQIYGASRYSPLRYPGELHVTHRHRIWLLTNLRAKKSLPPIQVPGTQSRDIYGQICPAAEKSNRQVTISPPRYPRVWHINLHDQPICLVVEKSKSPSSAHLPGKSLMTINRPPSIACSRQLMGVYFYKTKSARLSLNRS